MPRGSLTDLLARWRDGDRKVVDELLEKAYPSLKRIAANHVRRQPRHHTLQPTALVHEAYQRMARQVVDWQNRRQFYALMSTMMRRVLVDHARVRQRRGEPTSIHEDHGRTPAPDVDVLALKPALEGLEREHPFEAKVVELRYFGGLSILETAEALDVFHATVERAWTLARSWLYREIQGAARP